MDEGKIFDRKCKGSGEMTIIKIDPKRPKEAIKLAMEKDEDTMTKPSKPSNKPEDASSWPTDSKS